MTPAESRLREAVEHGYPHHTLTIEDGRGLVAEFDRLRAAVQHEADCVEAYRAQAETLVRERNEAQAERDALRAACKTTLMLRQLGGMMPGTKAVIDVAIHHAEEALAQIEQERSEQAKEG